MIVNKGELVKRYLVDGGESFSVRGIDMYRDGGSMVVDFVYTGDKEIQKCYVSKDFNDLSWDYDKTQRITNALFKAYLIERIERFIGDLNFKAELYNRFIKSIDE